VKTVEIKLMELLKQLLNHIIKTYNASIYWIDDEAPEFFTHIVLRNDTTSFSLYKTNKTHLVDLDLMSIKDLESKNPDADNYYICSYLGAKCFDDYVSRIKEYFEG
jgi:hypothetical protein